MNLVLTDEEAAALHDLLQVALGELSHEIAATDNPGFRAELVGRRDRLLLVEGALSRQLLVPATFDDGGDALTRELAWPGD